MMHLKFPQAVLAAGLVALPVGSKVILFEDTSYIVYRQDKDTLSNASEESIQRNLRMIEKILSIIHTPGCKICDPNKKHGLMKLRLGGPLGVRLWVGRDFQDTVYTARYNWSFTFPHDSNVGIVKSFSVRTKCVDDSSKPLAVPESCTVHSKKGAFAVARSFLGRLLDLHNQESQISAFCDTTWVRFQEPDFYRVGMEATLKNDIIDTRRVSIKINSKTGRVEFYVGVIYSRFDLSYRPSITRSRAFEIMRSEVAKVSPAAPDVRRVRLAPDDDGRWSWVFFLDIGKDSSAFAKSLNIDSETGRVLLRDLE